MNKLFSDIPRNHWPSTLELARMAATLRDGVHSNEEAVERAADIWRECFWFLQKEKAMVKDEPVVT